MRRGAIWLEYYATPTMNGHPNSYAAYTSIGNNVVGNQTVQVDANDQQCYIAGNTGTSSFRTVTPNPVEMVPDIP